MDPFDSIKRRLNGFLPNPHRWLLVALGASLLVITHDDHYEGKAFVSRHATPDPQLISTNSSKTPQARSDNPELTASASLMPIPASPFNQPEPEAAIPAETTPNTLAPDVVAEVKSGDNLSLIFDRVGLSPRDVYEVSRSTPQAPVLTSLYPGYILEFFLDDEKQIDNLIVRKNKLESTEISRAEDGSYVSTDVVLEPEVRQVFREATIDDSLFLAAQRGGISASIAMELAGVFGGVIDFLLDTRKGDTFNILYEEKFLDGEFIGNGAILAGQFTNQGVTYTAVRYVNMAGDVDFYNPDGESMRKAFLRNPVDFTRISDGFNPRRKHPILNTIRAHKGTDYAAPRGTPVVAAADGRVTWAARNGSFGKLVVVQHGERFQTKYAHLNDYARGIKDGARVKQGQVIGYVGATGSATGPHLHYEFLMDGVHRNSRTIHDQLPKAESVASSELQRFREHTQILLSQLEVHASDTENIALHTVDTQQ